MLKLKVFLCVMLIGLSGTGWAQKQIVCATVGQWPPMESLDKNGKMAGYTVDFMETAGRSAGFSIEFREVAEKDIVSGLKAGKYDAICSSMLNETLRREDLDFSEPYFLVQQAMVIHGKRKLFAADDWSGKRFGARKGTYGMETVTAMKEGLSIEYNAITRAMEDVLTRSLDGAVCDGPVARYYAHVQYKNGLKMAGYLSHSAKKPLSVAVAKDNLELLQLLNKGISAVRAKGIDQELQRKWFSR